MYNSKIVLEDKINCLISEGINKKTAQQKPFVSTKKVDLHSGYLMVLDPLI